MSSQINVAADTYTWSSARSKAVELFNEVPRPELEAELVELFSARPRLVLAEIERVGADLAAGRIRSGWPILRARLAGAGSDLERVVTDASERERAVAAALRWLRSAGCHFDRWEEAEDALFGPAGFADRGQSLSLWRDDPELRNKLFDSWCDLRPRAEEVEADEIRRAEQWKAGRPRRRGAHGGEVVHPWLEVAAL